jgi:choline dehydrogenase-like flavoprotein
MAAQRILIVGGGIAGSTLALLLAKHLPSSQITILERSTTQSELGQVVDIEGPSQEIMSRLNLLPLIREASTHEKGVEIVNAKGDLVARLPAGQSGGASKEIEILRPNLSKVIHDATLEHENVHWRFGKSVAAIEERQDDILVDYLRRNKRDTEGRIRHRRCRGRPAIENERPHSPGQPERKLHQIAGRICRFLQLAIREAGRTVRPVAQLTRVKERFRETNRQEHLICVLQRRKTR